MCISHYVLTKQWYSMHVNKYFLLVLIYSFMFVVKNALKTGLSSYLQIYLTVFKNA